jgi:xylulokinase
MFHDKASVIRAILEGVSFELRRVIESIEVCGIPVSELRVVGGGARSSLWLQIKADVTDRVMLTPDVTEAPSLGAAMLAGIGTKIYSNVRSACDLVYREKARHQPDPHSVALYDSQYQVYKEIYPALTKIFDDLADLGSP